MGKFRLPSENTKAESLISSCRTANLAARKRSISQWWAM